MKQLWEVVQAERALIIAAVRWYEVPDYSADYEGDKNNTLANLAECVHTYLEALKRGKEVRP